MKFSSPLRNVCVVGALSVSAVLAQTPTGSLQGTVVDSSGAVIPNAQITVRNQGTNYNKTLQTDGAGRFQVPLLPPGDYTVQVNAPGFRADEQHDINVEVNEGHPVNFKLNAGGADQTVEVSTTSANLETDTTATGAVITEKRIVDLPLNGRNPFDLAALTPGVNTTGGASTPHISGSRNANNETELDGQTNIAPENNVGNSSSVYNPIVDSVQEFNVQTSVLPAEYGRFSGGVISLITKSGTNKLHGSGFFFARNAVLDAKSYFSPAGTPIPDLKRYQEGGTLGGPLVIPHVYNGHDKTFFFVAYEKSNTNSANSGQFTVPTAAERSGDFSASGSTIYNPYQVNGTARTPFAGNIIPQALFSKVAIASLAYYPLPNIVANGYNFVSVGQDTDAYYHFDTKVDHNWTPNWHTFVRFSHFNDLGVPFSGFNNVASEGYNGPQNAGAYSLSYDNTFTFSPTLLAEVRYGLSRSATSRLPFGGTFPLTSLGFPSSFAANTNIQVFPNYNFGNSFSSLGSSGYVAYTENPTAHDVNGSIIKITHGHNLKFGGEYRKLLLNFHQFAQPSGSYGFYQASTRQDINNGGDSTDGNSFAGFLLGLPDYGYQTQDITTAQASAYIAAYAQDEWKATQRLTINLGLRWDVEVPRTERHNQLSYFDPNAPSPISAAVIATGVSPALCPACYNLKGAIQFVGQPGSKYGRHQAPTQYKDLAPRVGLSFQLDSKTVLRAGYGLVFAPSALQAAGTTGDAGTEGFATQTNYSFSHDGYHTINTTLDNPAKDGYNRALGVAGGPGTDLGTGISQSFFPSYRNPYSQQVNLNIQRALPLNTILEVGYIGNRGLFLPFGDPGVPYNQLTTNYLSISNTLNDNVPNPFYGIITVPGIDLSQQTVHRNQLLRPFPQYDNVTAVRKPGSQSNYQAFTLKVDKRFTNGLTFLVSYTGSKTFDTASAAVSYLGPSSSTYANQYNPNGEYSVSAYDIPRQLSSSFSYELPFGHGRHYLNGLNGITNAALSGFQIGGIISFNSGTPLIVGGGNDNAFLLGGGQRPNQIANAKISNPTRAKWFNTAAFVNAAPGTIGNAPRTIGNVRTPHYTNSDLSVFKNTYLGAAERYNLQLRLEAFNALNHPNFGGPDTGVNDGSNFGKINSTAGNSREVQLAVKFLF